MAHGHLEVSSDEKVLTFLLRIRDIPGGAECAFRLRHAGRRSSAPNHSENEVDPRSYNAVNRLSHKYFDYLDSDWLTMSKNPQEFVLRKGFVYLLQTTFL